MNKHELNRNAQHRTMQLVVINWQMSCHQCPHVRIVVEPGPCCAGVEVVAFAEQVVQLRQLAVADDAVEQPQMKCWV